MNKNLPAINQEAQVILNKSKKFINITNEILKNKNYDWMYKLFQWADKNKIKKYQLNWYNEYEGFPRNQNELLQLKQLILHFYEIKIFPKELCNLLNMEVLEFAWNSVTKIPREINHLINLKELSIGNTVPDEWRYGDKNYLEQYLKNTNCLTDLPETIYELKNLERLVLGHAPMGDYEGFGNRLTSISEKIKNLNKLKYLELDYNCLEALPETICELMNLEMLTLSHNKLLKLPSTIIQLTSIKLLDLTGNENLTLDTNQKKWINTLLKNGAEVYLDDRILDANSTFTEKGRL